MTEHIKKLVDKLDSHIHASEHEFTRNLKITPDITNEDLDDVFMSEDFDKSALLQ